MYKEETQSEDGEMRPEGTGKTSEGHVRVLSVKRDVRHVVKDMGLRCFRRVGRCDSLPRFVAQSLAASRNR